MLNIVSGCPRSGTSLLMNVMLTIFGEENIMGGGKPDLDFDYDAELAKLSNREQAIVWSQERALAAKGQTREKRLEIQAKTMDLNPNGFFECQYSVQGISYNYPDREQLKKYVSDGGDKLCMKIVSSGLRVSDPRFIGKVVYLIRHPRSVAKSQERLRTQLDMLFESNPGYEDMKQKMVVHSPRMYINSTRAASEFFLENPDIPVHPLHYDELIATPEKVIKDLAGFLGKNKKTVWSKAKNIVDPKLKRSYPEDIESDLWEDAEEVYRLFDKQDYQGVVDYLKPIHRNTNQANSNWVCARNGVLTNKAQCLNCINNPVVRTNFKRTANDKDIDWRNEPCLYECGMNLSLEDDQVLTMEESIANNFWRAGTERLVK
jgi:hypothetical protein